MRWSKLMNRQHLLTAFVFVKTDCRVEEAKTARLLAAIPEAQEVHRVAGEDCYVVKVRVADAEALGRLLEEKLSRLASVVAVETAIVLKTLKDVEPLPPGARNARTAKV
jgi:Lrp/AsnC family leucine-responsive transcriptional regulator